MIMDLMFGPLEDLANSPLADDFRRPVPQPLPSRRILLRGGTVLSLDPAVGDFVTGDVLIEDERILAVGDKLDATATEIDASGMIVMPGLVDAHRHLWSSMFRLARPNADGAAYSDLANRVLPCLTEDDVHHAVRLADASAIHCGITTMLDYAHLSKNAAVVDAGIEAHRLSGLRVVYAYAHPRSGPGAPEHPHDLERILRTHFSSDSGLVTLRLGTRLISENYALARRLGVAITSDGIFGVATPLRPTSSSERLLDMAAAGELGPDVTIVHGTGFPAEVVQALADHGVSLVLAPTSDMTLRGLGNSIPPIQGVLDHAMVDRTGLSVDVDACLSPDLFSQMRATFTLQRVLANSRWSLGEGAPEPISVQQVLRMATVGGAHSAGLLEKAGTLTPGKQADIIMVRADDILMAPLNSAAGSVVIGAGPEQVENVFVAGRLMKWKGKLVGVRKSALIERVRNSRDRLAMETGVWSPADIIR